MTDQISDAELMRDLADCLEDMTKHYIEVRNDLCGFEAAEELEVIAAGKIIAAARRAQTSAVSVGDNAAMELFVDAMAEADKAMRKFPQPNYVISKVAEEAGEVVKAAIHCAEGRDTPQHVAEEIRQTMAMLIRLYLEGDQVHGLPPVYSSLKAAQEGK
ncbi:hypothetical protein [Devosia alba]|uniref:hypothetical protein n=1 Tax=Devosia alba TaxID=3152360 RepID=UPI0032656389